MTMCVNFVKIRLVVFEFYAEGHSQSVSQSVSHALREIIIWIIKVPSWANSFSRIAQILTNFDFFFVPECVLSSVQGVYLYAVLVMILLLS